MRRRSNTTVLPSKSSYPRRRCQPDKMTAIEALHRGYARRLTGPPLRRSSVCIGICAALVVLLTFATFVHLSLFANMRLDVAGVFYTALALSSLIAIVPVAILWFLDRRERENPWLFAAAFLWGGFDRDRPCFAVQHGFLRASRHVGQAAPDHRTDAGTGCGNDADSTTFCTYCRGNVQSIGRAVDLLAVARRVRHHTGRSRLRGTCRSWFQLV